MNAQCYRPETKFRTFALPTNQPLSNSEKTDILPFSCFPKLPTPLAIPHSTQGKRVILAPMLFFALCLNDILIKARYF